MKKTLVLFVFFIYSLEAQQKPVETIYFDFDKYDLTASQENIVAYFIKNMITNMPTI